MAITNAEAIRFSNEVIRPLCEKFQWLKILTDDALNQWSLVAASIPNDADEALEDERQGEGVRQITGQDIHRVVTFLDSVATTMSDGTVPADLLKPSVRGVDIALRV